MADMKYPRTPHLPGSPGMTADDKRISSTGLAKLKSGIELICTEKMDGGNLTMTRNSFYSRSLTSGTQHWDTLAKQMWASLRYDIPKEWRISGESMYARRSVPYENLPGPYIVFGIWNENNDLLSWDETVTWCELLGLPHVPVLYRGKSFDAAIKAWGAKLNPDTSEGYVVRDAGSFNYADFKNHVGKYVRADHVRTRADWRHRDDYLTNTFK